MEGEKKEWEGKSNLKKNNEDEEREGIKWTTYPLNIEQLEFLLFKVINFVVSLNFSLLKLFHHYLDAMWLWSKLKEKLGRNWIERDKKEKGNRFGNERDCKE